MYSVVSMRTPLSYFFKAEEDSDPEAVQSETDEARHPVGRVGTPGDISAMAAYLVSDRAGFDTGQDFRFEGGMTKKMIYTI